MSCVKKNQIGHRVTLTCVMRVPADTDTFSSLLLSRPKAQGLRQEQEEIRSASSSAIRNTLHHTARYGAPAQNSQNQNQATRQIRNTTRATRDTDTGHEGARCAGTSRSGAAPFAPSTFAPTTYTRTIPATTASGCASQRIFCSLSLSRVRFGVAVAAPTRTLSTSQPTLSLH